jgi:oxygen-independent coproporphyrinogen-3 oxidase
MTESGGFGVYVHWPFCARICPYCDFNVYRDRGVDAARWSAALTRELEHWAARTKGRRLDSLYFGGGTPSLAPLSVIEAAIAACERLWGFCDNPEITIEANPTGAETERFRGFRGAGVNRLSLGVQALDDAALRFLGRDHDGAAALRAVERALAVFPHVNADLIYARPGQTPDQWADELRRATRTGVRHLSLYQLTIEPGTSFDWAVSRKRWAPADEDLAADLFDLTQEVTAAAGLPAYEVSNHAVPGEESRHNMIYWRQGDYVGVGPGAHGRISLDGRRIAMETALKPDRYLTLVEETGVGAVVNDPLTDEEAFAERLVMGLRTSEGVALSDAVRRRLASGIAELSADGLLIMKNERLLATSSGRRLLNAVLARLLA